MNLPIVAEKYVLLRKLATGGMAEVFLAKQMGPRGFERFVVLKRVLPHLAAHQEYIRMFLDETRTVQDLHHPNIVCIYEVGEDKGIYFMAMEYLYGQDLRAIFKKVSAQNQRIPLSLAIGMVIDVCKGLHCAHSKLGTNGELLRLVHRDVSPQNIIATYEGDTKILDFGIAKSSQATTETVSGVLKGKYSYMSPEQVQGELIDARTDIFALGIVLYELVTMKRLFKRESDMQTLKAITDCELSPMTLTDSNFPPELEAIIRKALAKNSQNRFQTCDELRFSLEEFLKNQEWHCSRDEISEYLKQLFKDEIAKETLTEANIDTLVLDEVEEFSEESSVTTIGKRSRFKWLTQIGVIAALGGVLGTVIVLAVFPKQSSTIESSHQKMNESIPSFSELLPKPVENHKKNEVVAPAPHKKIGDIKTKTVNLEPGRLKVVVEPWAEVYLDGERIGSTPFAPKALPAGKYVVKLENPVLEKNITKHVTIEAGRDTLLKHVW